MEHTKEPWQFEGSSYVAAKFPGKRPNGEVFFNTRYRGVVDMTEEQDTANARRIVACVNACAGVTTEDLERSTGIALRLKGQEMIVVDTWGQPAPADQG